MIKSGKKIIIIVVIYVFSLGCIKLYQADAQNNELTANLESSMQTQKKMIKEIQKMEEIIELKDEHIQAVEEKNKILKDINNL